MTASRLGAGRFTSSHEVHATSPANTIRDDILIRFILQINLAAKIPFLYQETTAQYIKNPNKKENYLSYLACTIRLSLFITIRLYPRANTYPLCF